MTQPNYRKGQSWKKRSKRKKIIKLDFAVDFLKASLKNGSWFKNLATLAILGGVLGLFVLAVLFAVYSRDLPDPNQLSTRHISQSTKIYDRTGEHLLYDIHGEEKRTLKKLQEGFCKDDQQITFDTEGGIPLTVVKAIIAVEDRNFCSHHGFSIKGIARAVLFGGSRGGGSTLTQQLVKNAILSNEQTLVRKVKELILSTELERRYSKDEILQIYFNEIPYGSTNYGIEAASQAYFGKTVADLSLAESATLAALPKAPTTYLNNPDRLKARRDFILDNMEEAGFITKTERDQTKKEETPVSVSVSNIIAPHFIFYIKEALDEAYGARIVEEGGLKVITTIDYDKQIAAEQIVKEKVDENGPRLGFNNAALVAIDPKNGHILSMVGSKDYFDDEIDGSVNVTTRPRQPGSSFKPIVYTAAFAKGYTPNTILWDVNTIFKTDVGDYPPKNYGGKEFGPVTIRQAIQGSLNTPAVKATYLVGLENAFNFAKRFGYSTFSDLSNYGLSLVLGGAEVKLLEHTNAYAVFANNGRQYPVASILRVEDPDGKVLQEWKASEGVEVISSDLAHLTTNVLSDNDARGYIFGPSSYLQLGDRPVASKTGTTNDSKDAWIMGYTPSLVVGVWAGNNRGASMNDNSGGSSAAGPIWNAFMKEALKNTPIESFPSVEITKTGKAIIDGQLPSTTVTIDRISGKLATEFTPNEFKETITCIDFHSILQYVDIDEPLGPPPSDPTKDSQYVSWEASIQDWVNRVNAENPETPPIRRCSAPTESDDVHTSANRPSVHITRADVEDGRTLNVETTTNAPRPLVRVEYRLDGIYIATSGRYPFSKRFEVPPSIKAGQHTLSATAFDDVGNSASGETSVQLGEPTRVAAIGLLDPVDGQIIEKTQSTYSVSLQVRNPTRFNTLSLFAAPRSTGERVLVGSITNPTSPFLTILWTLPDSGDWILTGVGQTNDNQLETTAGLIVSVKEGQPLTDQPSILDPFGLLP